MAKLELPFQDIADAFDTAVIAADLKRFVNVNIIANNSLKDKVCDVKKANPNAPGSIALRMRTELLSTLLVRSLLIVVLKMSIRRCYNSPDDGKVLPIFTE